MGDKTMRHYLSFGELSRRLALLGIISMVSVMTSAAHGAISWDGEGNSNWWFDPANWSQDANNLLPPGQESGGNVVVTDAQINVGSGAWDVTGEGVVYDPDNDPFFAAAASLQYPAGYGPQHIYRLYVSRNTTNTNVLTIKSGDLRIDDTTIIGRSGSTDSEQNLGMVVQTGGIVRLPTIALDIGQREAPTAENPQRWGNGIYDYRGGILEVQQQSGTGGIRLSHGSNSNGAGGHGRFIMRNPTTPGRVRTFDFTVASFGGPSGGNAALDPDGINTGVGIVEFHFENGGTRPIQVDRNLSINNGLDSDLFGVRSSRLEFKVNEPACAGDGCVPPNVGLFDVNFGGIFSGAITGTGDLSGDGIFNNDRVFSNADGTVHYREGDMVSASFGSTQYNWTISYTGNITWLNADDSVVDQVTGAGTGSDVVLIGHSSEAGVGIPGDFDGDGFVDGQDFLLWQRNTAVGNLSDWEANFGTTPLVAAMQAVPEPTSLVLLCLGLAPLVGRRVKRSIG